MELLEPASESSESSTMRVHASILPGVIDDDAAADSPALWLCFLNSFAALTKVAQLNLPQVMLLLIELRYLFVANPHFTWLNSVTFVSFPVFGSIDFWIKHVLPPWPVSSKVTWPSRQNVNAHSTCIGNRVSIILIKNQFFYYSSNWKRKSNKGIARFGLGVVVIEFWYSNHTINVVEMSCKNLNNKRAMKNILSDDLWWNESVTCRENSGSVRMTYLFFVSLMLLKRNVNLSGKELANSLQASFESKSLLSSLKKALTIASVAKPNPLCHSQTRWFT